MNQQGAVAELRALGYLRKQGLRLVERSFNGPNPLGEIGDGGDEG